MRLRGVFVFDPWGNNTLLKVTWVSFDVKSEWYDFDFGTRDNY